MAKLIDQVTPGKVLRFVATNACLARPIRGISKFVSPDHRPSGIPGVSRNFAKVAVFEASKEPGGKKTIADTAKIAKQ